MLYLGADHGGFALKENLKGWLSKVGYQFEDLGNTVLDPQDDYPDFAAAVACKVSENPGENRGILFCRSGVGADIVANKFKGVRCALIWSDNEALVQQSRQHDGTNVLSLPADHLSEEQARNIVKTWLETPSATEERHLRRLRKIEELERSL